MKQRHNSKLIPNTNTTVKEFKELAFKKFKAYPMMRINYQKNQFEICPTFYDGNININRDKLTSFCKKLGINYEWGHWGYSSTIVIKLG